MKALWTMMIVVLAAGLSACASTTAATKPTLEDLAAQIDDLQRQNTELRQQLGKRPALRQVEPANGDALGESLPPTNGRVLVQPEDMVPPPAKLRRGPPQNWAWLHTQPAGCSSGVYALTVVNQTDYYVNLMIDGESLRVRGSRGLLPGVPPHEKVYMCLGNTGRHTFTGELFALRYGQANKVGTYRFEGDFGGNTMSFGNQEVVIRDFWVTWTR